LSVTRLRVPSVLAALLVAFAISASSAWAEASPDATLLPVPQRSQADGSVWAPSNCGPASIAMVLETFGQRIPTNDLRAKANKLLGISSPSTGTRIQDLAEVVKGSYSLI
jgi:hypothetical protein